MESKNEKVDRKKGAKPQEKKAEAEIQKEEDEVKSQEKEKEIQKEEDEVKSQEKEKEIQKEEDEVKSQEKEKEKEKFSEPFAYKMYEIVLLSLFFSAMVSLLEIGSNIDLNLFSLILSNSSIFLPLLLSIAIYHVIYTKRHEFNECLNKWTIYSSISVTFVSVTIFQEIIPLLKQLPSEDSFLSLYIKSAILHPLSIMILALCYYWIYYRAFSRKAPFVMAFAILLIAPEASILHLRLQNFVGIPLVFFIEGALFIAFCVIREYWWRE